ncbi:MAG: GFA family protein [Rhodospirillales bacterium]
MRHVGGCHCGNISVSLSLSKPPAASALRACQCAFCRAHATRTVADPQGSFAVSAKDWGLVEKYRFDTRTADYLVCRRCGVYVAALCQTPQGLRAVVNVNALDDRALFTQAPQAHDYGGETPDARLARRARTWMPAEAKGAPD